VTRQEDVEEALMRALMIPERRRHYGARLATPKTRDKLLDSFFHLDLRRAPERGAPDRCYVMSAHSEVDGQDSDLRTALETSSAICRRHSFRACRSLRLLEGEEPNERHILDRQASA
jgi:hypothetical protein